MIEEDRPDNRSGLLYAKVCFCWPGIQTMLHVGRFYFLDELGGGNAKFFFKGSGEVGLCLYTHTVHHISNKNIFMNHDFFSFLQSYGADKFTNRLAGNTFNFVVQLGFAHTHFCREEIGIEVGVSHVCVNLG